MKKISFLILLALALFFTLMGCREEDLYVQKSESTQLSSTEDIHKRYQSSFESHLTVQKNLKKIQITNSLQKASAKINQNAVAKVQFADIHIYEKVIDTEKNVTTYSLPLITYTSSTPYFLKHLITVENGIEKSGFIKIIPSQPYTVNTEALDNFTGTVQILYDDLSVFSSSTFVNGVGQTTSTGGANSSALSKFECWNTVNIIVHGCTRGDNHPPGTKCDNGQVSDGYYEITTMMSCGEVDQHLSAPPGFAVMMGGGGGMSMNFYNLLYHPDFLYLDYVSQPESANILGMLAVLAYNGTFTISEVNEKVGIFFNNPQLLNDFNDLQLTINNNAGTSGMAGVFDPRIVKLMQNLFDNPTQQNADFTSWATQFYMQNPSSITNHFSQHPEDLEKILFKGLNYNKISDVAFANKFALAFTEILIAEKNNTVSQVNVQDPTWSLAKEYMIYLIKQNAASAVKYGRVIYEHASQYFTQHPNSLQKVNSFLEYLKAGVESEAQVITNPKYMKWTDVLLCWLFELGDFPVNNTTGFTLPTIGFSGSDYTISGITTPYIISMRHLTAHKMKNGIPDVNSVLDLKRIAIDNIQNGVLTPVNGEWVFGSDATVDTITKLDGMQFCLGSYRTDVYITPLGNNQYKLTYIIKNKTGWQSGTRGLNDYNGNPLDDSIIPDKPRGTGVHLGGTIGETFGWYEIITVP
ncbi:hypothetical protein HIO71_01275 [Chryseobacterium aquaticum]|uniref:Uncharacterized protein n=1 Tax=Chryseobacterium aquaticum TaxID=452084 RepID=A0A848N2C0_9FLAO|nr:MULTISPECIES: hypothetical protein [Chryseobacterium]NMR32830.1 hypothetical protein [Chryseobacterium aquaticum]NRQ45239.1 hypothetical protein [Chryseobacterium sp. C-204]